MKKNLTLLSIVFLLLIPSLHAQIIEPVKWSFKTKQIDKQTVELTAVAKIQEGWKLYGQHSDPLGGTPLEFTFKKSNKYKLVGKVSESPKPKKEYDDIMMANIQYFKKKAIFKQKIKILSQEDFTVEMSLLGQSCQESCIRFEKDHTFNIKGLGGKAEAETEAQPEETTADAQANEDSAIVKEPETPTQDVADNKQVVEEAKQAEPKEEDALHSAIDSKTSIWVIFWGAFLAGLVAIFTPCVFPMIPMTVSFFMHGESNKKKSMFEATVFGLSIVLIYTLIGTLVAVTIGPAAANWLSTSWVNVIFFVIFIVFAASFFGMFEIVLPNWMVAKSEAQVEKGGILAPFFMALSLVVVSFSCTGPILGTVIVQTAGGNFMRPIVGMLGFSIAFAIPFVIFAFFPHLMQNMPKSGGWLNSVKVVLGFIELAFGLKFLSIADLTYHWGILDRDVYLALWIGIFTLMGLYLIGKIKFAHDSDLPYLKVPRLMFALITFSFVAYMIPGMFGAPLKILSGYLPPMTTHNFNLSKIVRENSETYSAAGNTATACTTPKYSNFHELPHGLTGYFDYQQALECAKAQKKPILIDFTGYACVNCRKMEDNVWSDPTILKKLRNDFVIASLYVDDKTELPKEDWVVSKYDGKTKKTLGAKYADFQITRFKMNAQPAYIIVDYNDEVLYNEAYHYDPDVDRFNSFLQKGLDAFKQKFNK